MGSALTIALSASFRSEALGTIRLKASISKGIMERMKVLAMEDLCLSARMVLGDPYRLKNFMLTR